VSIGQFFRRHFHFYPFLVPGHEPSFATIGNPETRLGAMICYDDVVSLPARALRDAGAELLFVLWDEAWFGELERGQHLEIVRLRAMASLLEEWLA
jgi:apolipoprotein N-acyltransferase